MELGRDICKILDSWSHMNLDKCGNVGNPPPKQTAAQQNKFKSLKIWVRLCVRCVLQYHFGADSKMLKRLYMCDSAFYLCS